jgi:3-phosphoglycerate kinase
VLYYIASLELLEGTYILYTITEDKVSYVSTGGRASLELLEGTYILYNITQKIKILNWLHLQY